MAAADPQLQHLHRGPALQRRQHQAAHAVLHHPGGGQHGGDTRRYLQHTIYNTLYTREQVAAQPEHDPVPAPRPWAVDTWYYVEHGDSSSGQQPVVSSLVVLVAVLVLS